MKQYECSDGLCGAYDCLKCGGIDEEFEEALDNEMEHRGECDREQEAIAREVYEG